MRQKTAEQILAAWVIFSALGSLACIYSYFQSDYYPMPLLFFEDAIRALPGFLPDFIIGLYCIVVIPIGMMYCLLIIFQLFGIRIEEKRT